LPSSSKRPFERKEHKSDLSIFTESRLDHNVDTSDISLALRSTKQRKEGI